jgi:hypothetical protein
VTHPGAYCGASIGAAAAYTLAVLAGLPSFYYFPRLDAWGLQPLADEPTVRWYGYLLVGLIGGALGMLAGRAWPRPRWPLVWIAAAVCMVLLFAHEWSWFTR